MITLLIVILAIVAFCFLPFVRSVLRWIVFLPLAFVGGFLFNIIDIFGLMFSVFVSHLSPTLGLLLGVFNVLVDFYIVTIIARIVCPLPKTGWGIAFAICLIWSIYNLATYHTYVLFPFGVKDPSVPLPPIVWSHVAILATASFMGAVAAKGGAD